MNQSTTTTSQSFNLSRPAGVCAATGRAIEPGERFFAVVREKDGALQRMDFSAEAFSASPPADVLAYWTATMPHPEQKKPRLLVDDSVLLELFERLSDATEPARINFRFVLGLILIRKRLLQFERTAKKDGQEYWIVRPRGAEQGIELLNPRLDESAIEEVTRQVGEVLQQEVGTPAAGDQP
jgi:hypothetical protein